MTRDYGDMRISELYALVDERFDIKYRIKAINGEIWAATYKDDKPTGDVYVADKDGYLILVGCDEIGFPEQAPPEIKEWIRQTDRS